MEKVEEQQHAPADTRRRSLAGLFGDLFRESTALLHGEAELLRADLSDKVHRIQTGLGALGIGWLLTFSGILVLLASAVIALAQYVPEIDLWLSALIVGAVVTFIGLILLAKGRSNLKTRNLALHDSAESLRRDRDLIKERM